MTNPFGGGPKTAAPAKKAAAKAPAAKANAKPAAAAAADEDEGGAVQTLSKAGPRKDPFAAPSSSGGGDYKFQEFLGELLLVRPTEIDQMVTTASKGELQDYVRVDVFRLENPVEREDGTTGPEFVEDMLVFQTVLFKRFKKVLQGPNNWAIGRLSRGVEKNGHSAPYLFGDATPEEIDAAYKWSLEMGLEL